MSIRQTLKMKNSFSVQQTQNNKDCMSVQKTPKKRRTVLKNNKH